MKSKTSSFLAAALLLTASARAAHITSTWTGGDSGAFAWENDASWTPLTPGKPYPSNGVDTWSVYINDAPGDRVIQTSGALTISRLIMSQSSNTGSNTLKLGGDFTITNNIGSVSSGLANTTDPASASKLVLDLNGHTMTVNGVAGTMGSVNYMTLTGGGTYRVGQFYHSGGLTAVGDNVKVNVFGNGTPPSQHLQGVTWGVGSTFQYSYNNVVKSTIYHPGSLASGLHHLIVGDHTNTVASWAGFSNTALYIKGDVDVLTYAGATGGAAAKLTFLDNANIYIAGNFRDEGSDNENYGSGTLLFNGGRATERTLSTGRQGLTTNFSIGQNVSTPGNVRLGQNLTTTGGMTVLKESRLDVANFTLKATTVNIQSSVSVDPTVAFTFGLENSGLIEATGALTVAGAVLDITYDGTGWGGGDLELFRFGSLSGAPTAGDFTVNVLGGFSYDALVVGANSIYLSNVTVVPEPGSVFALLAGAALVGRSLARRRKTC